MWLAEGNKEFKAELQGRTGLNIATGAEACRFLIFNRLALAIP